MNAHKCRILIAWSRTLIPQGSLPRPDYGYAPQESSIPDPGMDVHQDLRRRAMSASSKPRKARSFAVVDPVPSSEWVSNAEVVWGWSRQSLCGHQHHLLSSDALLL